ncbi:hypothetical protein ACFWPK_34345 [Nocardia sp. NPDC058519]|uniref:hypothetical protein n=1 Tax=Nocardia sp. NPDC058519 TaxID=3346535 RepID=UPI003652853F
MIADFWDGRSFTRVDDEPDGRVAIEGYDGELCVHRTTYNRATAVLIGEALIRAAEEGQ